MSKIVVIGANHAGIAAANTILDNYPEQELVLVDKNSNLSYLGCGAALWIGKQIDDPLSLFYTSPEELRQKGATIHMETTVKKIDFNKKIVELVNKDEETTEETYDKLVLATGSIPVMPDIPGIKSDNVMCVKSYQDAAIIDEVLKAETIRNVAIVGAGYIGVEMAEAVKRRGKKVRLFDVAKTTLSNYYDDYFSFEMDKNLEQNGIELHLNEQVKQLNPDILSRNIKKIETNKGSYEVDLVIFSTGFKANSDLGKYRIACQKNGAYQVNRYQETSFPDIYAIGDCASVYNNAIENEDYIALATNAVRSGIVAGHNVCEQKIESVGVQGSNGISIFGYNMFSTGLTVSEAKKAGYQVEWTDFEDFQKLAFMKTENGEVKIRIVYDKQTRRILGAQIASELDVSMSIHLFSLAIQEKVTIDRFKLLDIFFLPHFNQPYNAITMASLLAE